MSSPVFRSVLGLGSKLDPIGHKAVEGIVRVDGLAAERTGKITGLNGLESEGHKNHSEPVRGSQNAARRQSLQMRAASLRQQIAALRSETANESPATLGDTQPSFQ